MSEELSIGEPARLRTAMRARRLSPLMAIVLATLAASAALAGAFALGAAFGDGDSSGSDKNEWRPPQLSALAASQPAAPAADPQTLSRPVFAKTRRPSVDKTVSAEETPKEDTGPATGLSVHAIIRYGKTHRAYVTAANAADGDWYTVGQKVEGWTIAEIRKTDLKLESTTGSAVLKLYPDAPKDAPAEPPKPAFAAPTPAPPASLPAPAAAPIPGPQGAPPPAPGALRDRRGLR